MTDLQTPSIKFALSLNPMTTFSSSTFLFLVTFFFFLVLVFLFLFFSPSSSSESDCSEDEADGEGVGGAPPGSAAIRDSHASERLILISSVLGRERSCEVVRGPCREVEKEGRWMSLGHWVLMSGQARVEMRRGRRTCDPTVAASLKRAIQG